MTAPAARFGDYELVRYLAAGGMADLYLARRAGLAGEVVIKRIQDRFLGHWSLMDLVAHLAGWDYANRAAIDAILAGRLPDFYARYDADWRTFNAELVARQDARLLIRPFIALHQHDLTLFAHPGGNCLPVCDAVRIDPGKHFL